MVVVLLARVGAVTVPPGPLPLLLLLLYTPSHREVCSYSTPPHTHTHTHTPPSVRPLLTPKPDHGAGPSGTKGVGLEVGDGYVAGSVLDLALAERGVEVKQ